MTGLEKILKTIQEEAQASADAIISQAEQEVEQILTAAKKEAELKSSQIAEKSEADVKDVISRAESAAALLERKLLLDTKQTIINEIIGKARKRLSELSDDEYTEMILSMVKKYSHNKKGRLLFPISDKKRLTKDFPEKLSAILSQKQGASLDIEEGALSFEGGFLLIYGDIEENCSFDALFAEERDALQDKVNSLLFD